MKQSNESGFTLIELLIVVGIIVALAAAIVPQVVQFGETRTTAQRVTEKETIQTGFENMMVEKAPTALTANTGVAATAVNGWTAQPTGTSTVPLYPGYFQNSTSTYFYCWGTDGRITFQRLTAAVCDQDD